MTKLSFFFRQLLESATLKLGFNSAARRVFLSNGEEAFRPEDIPRNAVVFISKGEPFSGYDGGKLGAFDIAVQFHSSHRESEAVHLEKIFLYNLCSYLFNSQTFARSFIFLALILRFCETITNRRYLLPHNSLTYCKSLKYSKCMIFEKLVVIFS